MKKTRATVISAVSIILLVIIFEIVTHFTSANGYYTGIDQLRAHEKMYDSSTVFYTQEMADRYVDFLVDKDDNFCAVEISKKSTWLGMKYSIGVSSVRPISDMIRYDVFLYDKSETPHFTGLPNMFGKKPKVNLLYCVAQDGSEFSDETVKTVPFTYNENQYLLCIKLEVNR